MDIQSELNDDERREVADRLLDEQRERFDGVRKAAYIAAGVNPATWTRAIGGQRIRPDRLVQIVKSLWPASNGRWEAVPAARDVRSWPGVPDYVEQGDWTGGIDNAMADVDGRFVALESRVRDLEFLLAEMTEATEDDNTQIEKAGGDDGTQASTQKNELERAREMKERAREDLSEDDETLAPAALDAIEGVDEEPGGSAADES